MLEAWPKGMISTGFEITENGQRLGSLDYKLITLAFEADLTLGSVTYKAYCTWKRRGFISFSPEHSFYLEGPDGVIATSQPRGSWPSRTYPIFFDGQEYVLEYYFTWILLDILYARADFPFKQQGRQLGVIKAGGFLCWRYEVALPEEVPLLVRLFALYLASVVQSYSPVRLFYCLRGKRPHNNSLQRTPIAGP